MSRSAREREGQDRQQAPLSLSLQRSGSVVGPASWSINSPDSAVVVTSMLTVPGDSNRGSYIRGIIHLRQFAGLLSPRRHVAKRKRERVRREREKTGMWARCVSEAVVVALLHLKQYYVRIHFGITIVPGPDIEVRSAGCEGCVGGDRVWGEKTGDCARREGSLRLRLSELLRPCRA